ncbi:MAG: TldD/PmbA family protein [Gammaproteobacteria bacterium]
MHTGLPGPDGGLGLMFARDLNPTEVEGVLGALLPTGARWTARYSSEDGQFIACRQDIPQPLFTGSTEGVAVTVYLPGGGIGWGAYRDTGRDGLRRAAEFALDWAQASEGLLLAGLSDAPLPVDRGEYGSRPAQPWDGLPLSERIDEVRRACAALKIDDRIVDWSAHVGHRITRTRLFSSAGADIHQHFEFLTPGLSATANVGASTERRTGGGVNSGRQGGVEQLFDVGFAGDAARVAEEALALLYAEDCPSGVRDLVLMPSQLVLQIHESIGHPLELDRILGDERNYAGTSFVTPDMFGAYRYGSPLLNVTFDPGRPEQIASYGWDDEGMRAQREYLIRDGVLLRPLGGGLSQARSGLPGVSSARACQWNRPPIDRMANLNLEPGDSTLEALIAGVEDGVLMDTNRSWSIDDSRNKFQFGCEYGRLIRDGELRGLVRNPNYRGISAGFWRSLDGVGTGADLRVAGVTNCGKGEPNQSIYVGHATPPCRFRGVEIFGALE